MNDDPAKPAPPSGGDDMDPLGAAPTRAVRRSSSPRPRRSPKSIGRRRALTRIGLVVVLVVGIALLPALRTSVKKTPLNKVGISYGGGPFEAAHFQKVVQPGSALFFNGFFDRLYLYPSDTQTYIVSKDPNEGDLEQVDSITAPSRDRVQIEYQVAVYFKLNTDRLADFHEQLGLQYGAYKTAGWQRLIRDTFRQQIENVLQEETRKRDVADLYGDANVLISIQDEVEVSLGDGLAQALGEPFMCGPTFHPGGPCDPPRFIIKKVDIPSSVAQAFEDNRTSQIKVLTSENQIAQRAAEARAIEALNEGLAKAGMPYVLLKAIESGKISFWVLPSDSGVTLQAPTPTDGSADPTAPAPAGEG